MNPVIGKKLPEHMQQELKLIRDHVRPLLKKSYWYSFLSMPLLLLSLINLFGILIYEGVGQETIPPLLAFALFAAVGLALRKEMAVLNKKIQQVSNKHIVQRILTSENVSDYQKKEFVQSIEGKPMIGFQLFINFLEEEQKRKQYKDEAAS